MSSTCQLDKLLLGENVGFDYRCKISAEVNYNHLIINLLRMYKEEFTEIARIYLHFGGIGNKNPGNLRFVKGVNNKIVRCGEYFVSDYWHWYCLGMSGYVN